MIKIAVVDDEKKQLSLLKKYIDKISVENKISFSVSLYDNSVVFITNYKSDFDIIFLDIDMPHMDGFSLAKKIRETDPSVIIIFITNMQQYAIKGYEVEAVGFLVKPVEYFNFSNLMKKVLRIHGMKEEKVLNVNSNGNVMRIPVSSIYYIEVSRHRITFHTEYGDIESWGALNAIEQELPKGCFSRCNVCYLVSLRHVKYIDGDEVMVGGDSLKISRMRKKEFKSDLAKYLGNR